MLFSGVVGGCFLGYFGHIGVVEFWGDLGGLQVGWEVLVFF